MLHPTTVSTTGTSTATSTTPAGWSTAKLFVTIDKLKIPQNRPQKQSAGRAAAVFRSLFHGRSDSSFYTLNLGKK
ncbi:MAG: hypothetical protein R2788_14250 [Saprospiraceae bacterium]